MPKPKSAPMRDATTQTGENDDAHMLAIARLQEQINLLTIENRVLIEHTVRGSSIVTRSTPKKTNIGLIEHGSESVQKSSKRCTCKGNCGSQKCGCVKKDKKCGYLCRCDQESCQNRENEDDNRENSPMGKSLNSFESSGLFSPVGINKGTGDFLQTPSNFDPTKPKHQLLRTPPHSRSAPIPPISEFLEEKHSKLSESLEPSVDWNEHQAKLIPCGKCKRKFNPVRIMKHEEVCKGV